MQTILNKVLALNIYHPEDQDIDQAYMCCCLEIARKEGVITPQEHAYAVGEIQDYLLELGGDPYESLFRALEIANLPNQPTDLRKIYQDWGRRPQIL